MTETESEPEDHAARAAELQRQLDALQASTTQRLIRAELKAHAVRAGMVDLDGLKLIDTATVTLDEDGELAGGAALMEAFRHAKPWLFAAANSSTPASPPPSQPPKAKKATEMTVAEWKAARAELLRHR